MASLVAAVPAAGLAALLIMTFITGEHATEVTGNVPLLILVGATLAVSALVALMPAGVLIFAGGSKVAVGDDVLVEDQRDTDAEGDSPFVDEDDDPFVDEEDDDEDPFAEDESDDESDDELQIEGLDEEDIFATDDDDDVFDFEDA
tara:strand:- start:302 stop:739 length:438 start_codon:yes stop_codon:yes gene_type:complete